jgi:hypothetical protein
MRLRATPLQLADVRRLPAENTSQDRPRLNHRPRLDIDRSSQRPERYQQQLEKPEGRGQSIAGLREAGRSGGDPRHWLSHSSPTTRMAGIYAHNQAPDVSQSYQNTVLEKNWWVAPWKLPAKEAANAFRLGSADFSAPALSAQAEQPELCLIASSLPYVGMRIACCRQRPRWRAPQSRWD